jgi:Ca-activated chloride channel family protein
MNNLKKAGFKNSPFFWFRNSLILGLVISYFLLFANPHISWIDQKIEKDGIDIVLLLDISKSMEATDLTPNRIEAAKNVINNFVDKIETDRVWLVVFAGKPFSSIPLTYDYEIIKEIIWDLNTDTLNQNINGLDGTAIWDAILLWKNILDASNENDETREKIIVLLTDGDANRWVEPSLAAKSANENDIKIYSIGIWSKEGWKIQFQNWPFIQEQTIPPLKENTLREIAQISRAKFFRATDNRSLESIFEEIEKLEKTSIEITVEKSFESYYLVFFYVILWLSLLLFWSHIFIKK